MSDVPPASPSTDHYRRRAEQEHGHKRITLSDGSAVTLLRPLRMTEDQRKQYNAARIAAGKAMDDHPELVRAREAWTLAYQDREKLTEDASQSLIDKRDERLAKARTKLDEAFEKHGEHVSAKEDRVLAAQRDLIRAGAESREDAEKLLNEFDNFMVGLLIQDWDTEAELGEASPSPS